MTRTQNASTHTHIFKTRWRNTIQTSRKALKVRLLRSFVLFLVRYILSLCFKRTISHPLSGGSRRDVSPFFLSSLNKNRFIHRRFVLRKQILLGRETNLRRGTFLNSIRSSRFCRERLFCARRSFVRRIIIGWEIEESKDFCSSKSKALMRKN